jgi:hypothetical protein
MKLGARIFKTGIAIAYPRLAAHSPSPALVRSCTLRFSQPFIVLLTIVEQHKELIGICSQVIPI